MAEGGVVAIDGGVITAGGDLGVGDDGNLVTGIWGVPIEDIAPADGDVLTYVAADGKWEPQPPPAGGLTLTNNFLLMGG